VISTVRISRCARLSKIALVDEYGAYLQVKDGRFRLKIGDTIKWEVSPIELDSIVFTVDGASISASSVMLAASYGIDLVFIKGSRPIARLLTAKYGSTMLTWLDQLKRVSSEEERSRLASLFIDGKIHNQRMVIYEYAHKARATGSRIAELEDAVERLKDLQSSLVYCRSVEDIINVEAHAANVYWRAIATLIPKQIGFEHRLTRQRIRAGMSPDPFNIALNIGYSILRKEVWRAVFLAGLNPYVGFLHRERSGRMSLVLDLMEEFRAHCVDRPLIALARQSPDMIMKINESVRGERNRNERERGNGKEEGGESKEKGSTKRKKKESKEGTERGETDGIKEVWKAVINRMKEREDMVSVIVNQARLLAKDIRGSDRYKPFKSRW